MKLLIVDDHPTNLRLLRAQLETAGHDVVEAADGVEALQLLEREPIDVVISDVLMPNMDGFRLCLEVRKSPRFGKVPFIIYTSTYNSASDRKLALDAGADRYLAKPAPATEVLRTVEEVCGEVRSQASRELPPFEELGVFKQYNAALVTKLEERNAELVKANEELRASETRYHGTLDGMLEGCQIIGYDWRYLYLNDTAAWHGQHEKENLIGRTLMECYPGFERTDVFPVLRRCMTERVGARVENEFTHADGATSWFELSIQPVPEGIFILSLDITERKRAMHQIREQLDELLRWQTVMLDREERVQALKAEVNDLLTQQGRPARYASPIQP